MERMDREKKRAQRARRARARALSLNTNTLSLASPGAPECCCVDFSPTYGRESGDERKKRAARPTSFPFSLIIFPFPFSLISPFSFPGRHRPPRRHPGPRHEHGPARDGLDHG